MAHTTSVSFPNMFDVSRNRVAVLTDDNSVVNRVRLLFLTDPTEVFHNPTQGLGLKQFLWQYNTENTHAIIRDKMRDQLRLHEPSVDPDSSVITDGLLSDHDLSEPQQDYQKVKMTVGLRTLYGDDIKIPIDMNKERNKLFGTELEDS